MTQLTPRTKELVQGFAAASLSSNTSPSKTPTSPPNNDNNNIPQVNDNTASPNVGGTVLSRPNLPVSETTSAAVKANTTEPPQTEEEKNSTFHSTRQPAPPQHSFVPTTRNPPPVSRLPPIPSNDALILKISHLLLIDYATAAKFHRAIISSTDASITPASSEYFECVGAPNPVLYPQTVSELGVVFNISVCIVSSLPSTPSLHGRCSVVAF